MPDGDLTELLHRWSAGDKGALERLTPLVYNELKRVAHRQLRRERADHTLDTAALVHEAYLRLVDQTKATWHDRSHFFAVCGRMMRRILVDYARSQHREKRGGGRPELPLNEAIDVPMQKNHEWIVLDDALNDLAKLDEEQSRVVELRFFAGLSIAETAEALGISTATADRKWATARAWLLREINYEK
jgi:RNA polymerase sigma factor (TIGR02999 family)